VISRRVSAGVTLAFIGPNEVMAISALRLDTPLNDEVTWSSARRLYRNRPRRNLCSPHGPKS